MKKIWICLLSIAVFGIILMAAGYALGADPGFLNSKKSKITKEEKNGGLIREDTGSISEIYIDVLSADIEIISSDSYGYAISSNNSAEITHEFSDGKLIISQNTDWSPFRWFSFFGPFWGPHAGTISVFLADNAELDSMSIKTLSGNISVLDVLTGDLTLSSKSGKINVDETAAERLEVRVTSGSVSLTDCSTTDSSVHITSGHFTADDFYTRDRFYADLVSGHSRISGDLRGDTQIKVISGKVTLDLDGAKADYNADLSSVSGVIRVNGRKTGSFESASAASNNLFVKTTSGAISVDFAN